MLVKTLGRRRWKKVSGYHRQGRVENTFFRYKSIIEMASGPGAQPGRGGEVVLGCEILNRMTALGRQCRIASTGEDPVGGHRAGQSRFVQQRPLFGHRSSPHIPASMTDVASGPTKGIAKAWRSTWGGRSRRGDSSESWRNSSRCTAGRPPRCGWTMAPS